MVLLKWEPLRIEMPRNVGYAVCKVSRVQALNQVVQGSDRLCLLLRVRRLFIFLNLSLPIRAVAIPPPPEEPME